MPELTPDQQRLLKVIASHLVCSSATLIREFDLDGSLEPILYWSLHLYALIEQGLVERFDNGCFRATECGRLIAFAIVKTPLTARGEELVH